MYEGDDDEERTECAEWKWKWVLWLPWKSQHYIGRTRRDTQHTYGCYKGIMI